MKSCLGVAAAGVVLLVVFGNLAESQGWGWGFIAVLGVFVIIGAPLIVLAYQFVRDVFD